jgi:6-pyruvoyl-tetrahydropterin synthase
VSSLFVEQLTVIDCAYLDAQRGLVGESWIVDIVLEGDLDPQSMVLDFGEVKRRLKRAIDAGVDHTLVVPGRAPGLERVQEAGDGLWLAFASADGRIEHRSPACAVTLLDAERVTSTAVAAQVRQSLQPLLPPNVSALHLELRCEAIDGPWYHYVHGLKKHAGQCQRIAHGHRSRLEVRVDGARDRALEEDLAGAWRDIYLGTREDLVARADGALRFAYAAPEGRFELALPQGRVDLLDTDSTVERIAEHLARLAAGRRPGRVVEVRAYEGVMKGALARA